MRSLRTRIPGARAVLAGDGGLLTAAALAVVLALALALGSGSHASNVAGISGMAAAIVLGPLAAWRLHKLRADGSATAGAVLGFIAGFVSVWVILPVAWLLAYVVVALGAVVGVSVSSSAGASVVGVAIAALYLVAACWLDIAALRDLAPARRTHVVLDIARLVATVAYAAYVAGVILLVTPGSAADAGMSTVLLLAVPGSVGAVVVTIAGLVVTRDEQRSRGRLISGL